MADGAPWQKAALFCTPPWATRTLFRVVLPRLGVGPMLPNIVWEPCAGLGHMSKVIEEFATATFASDINDFGAPDVAAGLDACDHSEYWNAFVQGRPDWIITNPPFSPDPPLKSAAEMLPGFLHFARVGVALLCRLQWLETEERHALLSEFPPSLVAIFSERVPMCEGGYDPKCKSASAYAWFIWKRQEDGQWPRCLADGQFTAFLIPPGQKKAWFKPSDLLLAKRHVPGFVPPSVRRKEREAARKAVPPVTAHEIELELDGLKKAVEQYKRDYAAGRPVPPWFIAEFIQGGSS
ncbi:hypothetical protein [Rhodoblastus acidophilus]|uniref:hypothetical protein n=1 Tax=Rhodoblastus acidophilus TaxID=1074 RepID=UPI0011B0AEC0|nr:hypothetical protein [Rhodoblastus acidophilus]